MASTTPASALLSPRPGVPARWAVTGLTAARQRLDVVMAPDGGSPVPGHGRSAWSTSGHQLMTSAKGYGPGWCEYHLISHFSPSSSIVRNGDDLICIAIAANASAGKRATNSAPCCRAAGAPGARVHATGEAQSPDLGRPWTVRELDAARRRGGLRSATANPAWPIGAQPADRVP